MAFQSTSSSRDAFFTQHARLIEALFTEANAARWGLGRALFAEALWRSAQKRFRGTPGDPSVTEAYLKSLHLEDLGLACACAEGIESAWEFFVEHFREDLRGASRSILRSTGHGNDSRAAELADSLYADLYGIRSSKGERGKSLFEYFHGRSKLSTWLRVVLAQRHVDLLRANRGMISLDAGVDGKEGETLQDVPRRPDSSTVDPDRAHYLSRLDAALSFALAALLARERMLLSCYYVDELTLAQIGRALGEHESSVSRQLAQTRRKLRETVVNVLRQQTPAKDGLNGAAGLDESQVELAFEYALEDWPFDLSRALSKAESDFERREKRAQPGR